MFFFHFNVFKNYLKILKWKSIINKKLLLETIKYLAVYGEYTFSKSPTHVTPLAVCQFRHDSATALQIIRQKRLTMMTMLKFYNHHYPRARSKLTYSSGREKELNFQCFLPSPFKSCCSRWEWKGGRQKTDIDDCANNRDSAAACLLSPPLAGIVNERSRSEVSTGPEFRCSSSTIQWMRLI